MTRLLSWLLRFLLMFCCVGLLWLLLRPYAEFSPYISWYNGQGKQSPPTCLPVVQMAYTQSQYGSALVRYAADLLTPAKTHLPMPWQPNFLFELIRSKALLGPAPAPPLPHLIPRFLTPRMLCDAICPRPGELLYDQPPDVTAEAIGRCAVRSLRPFSAWPPDVEGGAGGLRDRWTAVLASWGCWLEGGTFRASRDTWESAPSNFLYRCYQIPANAPCLEAWLFETSESQSHRLWFPELLDILLGTKGPVGWGTGLGWVGAVQFFGFRDLYQGSSGRQGGETALNEHLFNSQSSSSQGGSGHSDDAPNPNCTPWSWASDVGGACAGGLCLGGAYTGLAFCAFQGGMAAAGKFESCRSA